MIVQVGGLNTGHTVNMMGGHVEWNADAEIYVSRITNEQIQDVAKSVDGNFHYDAFTGKFEGSGKVKLTPEEKEKYNWLMQAIQDRLVKEYGASQDYS